MLKKRKLGSGFSLLMVMVHEVGHVLGLGHSNVISVIMYPWYQDKVRELDIDDKNAIVQLYGHHGALNPSKPTAKPTDPTPATKRTTKHYSFLWKLDLNNLLIPELPDNLDNYVPTGIEPSSISHIFQNSAIDKKNHKYYITSFPGLNIKRMYEFPISADAEINSVFQTYSGSTFLFFDNDPYIQFIEHPQQLVGRGRVSDVFPGIPKNITSAFRYIDGFIYFFSHCTY
nr:unnamed protein product [Callosobruchus analis]